MQTNDDGLICSLATKLRWKFVDKYFLFTKSAVVAAVGWIIGAFSLLISFSCAGNKLAWIGSCESCWTGSLIGIGTSCTTDFGTSSSCALISGLDGVNSFWTSGAVPTTAGDFSSYINHTMNRKKLITIILITRHKKNWEFCV